jgi:hypothetical protein
MKVLRLPEYDIQTSDYRLGRTGFLSLEADITTTSDKVLEVPRIESRCQLELKKTRDEQGGPSLDPSFNLQKP